MRRHVTSVRGSDHLGSRLAVVHARGRQICEINLRSWHFGCPASPAGLQSLRRPGCGSCQCRPASRSSEVQPAGHLGNPCVLTDGWMPWPSGRPRRRIYGPASSHVRRKGERERGDPAKHAAGRELPDGFASWHHAPTQLCPGRTVWMPIPTNVGQGRASPKSHVGGYECRGSVPQRRIQRTPCEAKLSHWAGVPPQGQPEAAAAWRRMLHAHTVYKLPPPR